MCYLKREGEESGCAALFPLSLIKLLRWPSEVEAQILLRIDK
jgi:hypothetical protein